VSKKREKKYWIGVVRSTNVKLLSIKKSGLKKPGCQNLKIGTSFKTCRPGIDFDQYIQNYLRYLFLLSISPMPFDDGLI
jgi:hypothetical protein